MISPFQQHQFLDNTACFPTLADGEQNLLVRPIQEMEVHAANMPIKEWTSPGADRLTAKFYQWFIDLFSLVLSRAFSDVNLFVLQDNNKAH